MDISLILDYLIPNAKYSGSLTPNTKETYDALVWEDERLKPTWEEILQVGAELNVINLKEKTIQDIQNEFNLAVNQTLNYKDHPFKISYCLQYQIFEGRYTDNVMTLRIWDATEKDYLDLNKTDFVELKLLLAEQYEVAFQAMKQGIAGLI